MVGKAVWRFACFQAVVLLLGSSALAKAGDTGSRSWVIAAVITMELLLVGDLVISWRRSRRPNDHTADTR